MTFHTMQTVVLFAASAGGLCVAVYVLVHNPKHIVNRSFFVFVLGGALWGMGIALLFRTHLFVFDKLIFYGGLLMFFGLTLFAKTFPNGQPPKRTFYLVFIPLVAALLAVPFDVFVKGLVIHPNGAIEPINGPAMPLFVLVIGIYFFLSAFYFITHYAKATLLARLQFGYLFFGIGIFTTSVLVFDTILPAFGVFAFNLLGPSAFLFVVVFASYAIARHQLLDIKIIIGRGVIYTALLLIVIGTYLVLLMLVSALFHKTYETAALWSAGITTVLGIFGVPVIERWFREMTDSFFFKGRYDYSSALYELSRALHAHISLERIVGASSKKLRRILKTGRVHFSFFDAPRDSFSSNVSVRNNGSRLTVPLVLDDRLIGRITLHEKRSGEPYTRTDIRLMQTFAYQAAIAIERGKLHEKVSEYSRTLEEKVKERTREIETLQKNQKQMMVDISHGLQTPLAVLKSEIVRLETQKPDGKKLRVFEKSIDEVSAFIYKLLHLARLETMPEHEGATHFSLSEALEEQAEYFATIAENKGITIRTDIEKGIEVYGRKKDIKELVINLVSNAMKYVKPRGARTIDIVLKKDGDRAVIIVADTGIGIRAADLSYIFERFYRSTSKSNTGIRGIGLGLAICKKIVEKHRGTIRVESVDGSGTRFVIELPTAHLETKEK